MNQPVVKIVWLDDPRYEYPLPQGSFVIGRDATCNLPLDRNEKASRRHAEILFHQGQFWLRDLQSHNGTKLNGAKITQEALFDGDLISIGGVRFRVVHPWAPAPPDRAAAQQQAVAVKEELDASGTVLQMKGDLRPQRSGKPLVLLGGIVGGVCVLGLLYALISGGGGGGGSGGFPDAAPYGDLRISVKELAFVTYPFSGFQRKNPEIFTISPVANEPFIVRIQGIAAGSGELYLQSMDKKSWVRVRIFVDPITPWPPGWEDEDRHKEATKLVAEADALVKSKLDFPTTLRGYYLYSKASRLFENCKMYNAENDRVRAAMQELQSEIDGKEFEMVGALKAAMTSGDNAKAKEIAGQLLRLFPADGIGGNVMASHGDPVKYRQYSMLSEYLDTLIQK